MVRPEVHSGIAEIRLDRFAGGGSVCTCSRVEGVACKCNLVGEDCTTDCSRTVWSRVAYSRIHRPVYRGTVDNPRTSQYPIALESSRSRPHKWSSLHYPSASCPSYIGTILVNQVVTCAPMWPPVTMWCKNVVYYLSYMSQGKITTS